MVTKKKNKKFDRRGQYDFSLEEGLIEKKAYSDIKRNPTAIIYVRVSDPKQVTEGNGLESQAATCRRWAEGKGVSIIKIFSDGGITGATFERKWLEEAITYLKQENKTFPKISYFLCTEVARISRNENVDETAVMKKAIENTGVNIITTNNGMNISDKSTSNEFMTDIQIAVAKNERLLIRDRSINGSKAKLYNGERVFYPPVWYDRIHIKINGKIEKRLEKVEPQSSIIKEGLELFADWIIVNNSKLLAFFNEKGLKSNYHSPNPWKLRLTFISRILQIEKLYFYAGYIFYPNPIYGITKPVQAIHQPLISLSTMKKIIQRTQQKGNAKMWIRKDTSDDYPLRGVVFCPYCNHPMTWRASKGKMGKYYNYYGCNRKDCSQKECIPVDILHTDYEKLLSSFIPKEGVINLIEGILKEVVKEKNKMLNTFNESKKLRINEIDKEILIINNKIEKLSKIELIQKLEEEWALLEQEKENIQKQIGDSSLNENEFVLLYDRVKTLIIDPMTIREIWTTELRLLQAWVLFWGKFYYKKKEGFQTPQISVLHTIINGFGNPEVSCGAGDGTRTRNSLLGRQAL